MTIEHSRALKLGSAATGLPGSKLEARLSQSLVTVRIDPTLHGALLCGRVLLSTLRRNPGRLALVRGSLRDTHIAALASEVAAIDSTQPLELVEGPDNQSALNIDIATQSLPGWFRIVPDGHGARLANDARPDIQQAYPPDALGCVMTAALGAAEAFKYTAGVLKERCRRHEQLAFCPVTLGDDLASPHDDVGAPLDLALVGLGAIGTASALILSELKLGGRIIVCDPEAFARANKGTYSLGGEHEATTLPPKTDLAAAALEAAGYQVIKVLDTSERLVHLVDAGEIAMPAVVLTGLDSREARRQTQELWADYIIDGQTGDTAAGLCVATPEGPCLRCFFPSEHARQSALDRLAESTGILAARLADGGSLVQDEDVQHLPPETRRQLVGTPMCGVADVLGLTYTGADGYMPSIPFVSQFAACMVVGRMLALRQGLPPASNRFQLDVLQGPNDTPDVMKPAGDCQCQRRPEVIRAVRANHRRSQRPGRGSHRADARTQS